MCLDLSPAYVVVAEGGMSGKKNKQPRNYFSRDVDAAAGAGAAFIRLVCCVSGGRPQDLACISKFFELFHRKSIGSHCHQVFHVIFKLEAAFGDAGIGIEPVVFQVEIRLAGLAVDEMV